MGHQRLVKRSYCSNLDPKRGKKEKESQQGWFWNEARTVHIYAGIWLEECNFPHEVPGSCFTYIEHLLLHQEAARVYDSRILLWIFCR